MTTASTSSPRRLGRCRGARRRVEREGFFLSADRSDDPDGLRPPIESVWFQARELHGVLRSDVDDHARGRFRVPFELFFPRVLVMPGRSTCCSTAAWSVSRIGRWGRARQRVGSPAAMMPFVVGSKMFPTARSGSRPRSDAVAEGLEHAPVNRPRFGLVCPAETLIMSTPRLSAPARSRPPRRRRRLLRPSPSPRCGPKRLPWARRAAGGNYLEGSAGGSRLRRTRRCAGSRGVRNAEGDSRGRRGSREVEAGLVRHPRARSNSRSPVHVRRSIGRGSGSWGVGNRGRAEDGPVALVEGLVGPFPFELRRALGPGVPELHRDLRPGPTVRELHDSLPRGEVLFPVHSRAARADTRVLGHVRHLGINQGRSSHGARAEVHQVEIGGVRSRRCMHIGRPRRGSRARAPSDEGREHRGTDAPPERRENQTRTPPSISGPVSSGSHG
jgi:hypothetical protein